MYQIHWIQIKKLWWQQIQKLGFMEIVINTHAYKNALRIKI